MEFSCRIKVLRLALKYSSFSIFKISRWKMAKNFLQRLRSDSFWPITYFSWLYYHWMGSSVVQGAIFSVFIVTIHLSVWIFRYNRNTLERGKQAQTNVANILFYCLVAINSATVPLLVMIWMFRGRQRVRNFVSEIASVDNKLLNFGESPSKNTTIAKLLFPSYGVSLITIVFLMWREMNYHGSRPTDVVHISRFEYIYFFHDLGVKLYVQCLFVSCVLLLGDRYDAVNSVLEKMAEEYKFSDHRNTRELTSDWVIKLRELRTVNRKLFFAAEGVSGAFNLQLLITGITSLTITIGELYNFYLMNALSCNFESSHSTEYLLECGIMIGQFYVIMFSCSRTYSKEGFTSGLLHDLKVTDESLRIEIKVFSLQLMHHKIKFSACGLWDVDLTFTVTIISTILTYLIILVQIGTLPKNCRSDFIPTASENSTNSSINI